MNLLSTIRKLVALSVFAATGSFVVMSPLSFAQAQADKHDPPPTNDAATANDDLATQLQRLRKKVAGLEAILQSQHQSRSAANAADQSRAMPNMSMNDSTDPSSSTAKKGGMQMGDKKMEMMKGVGGMSQDAGGQSMSSGGMGMGMMGGEMRGMKGMGMMGRNPAMQSSMSGMGSMGSMNLPSALPGFAGASHLYHIGETGFFLDHRQHIALTDEQQLQLNKIKEAALLATATAERKIDEAEQELWTLTAEAQPEINKIEAKARAIAQLQADNRIAFIRSVGKAAQVLTEEQRQILVGMVAPEYSIKAE